MAALDRLLAASRGGRWTLNDEQHALARRILVDHQNVYYCGEGGSGKTRLAEFLMYALDRLDVPHMAVAPSGQAAQLLSGFTIHQAFGLLPQTRVKDGRASNGHNEMRPRWRLKSALRKARVLFLDEASMVSAPLFEDMVRRITAIHGMGVFGGVQVVALGDPLQLPPVGKDGTPEARYCFESPEWARVFPPSQCFRLQRQMRQLPPSGDDGQLVARHEQFAQAMAELRRGRCPPEVVALLRTRMYTHDCAPDFRTTPYLFSTREETDSHNRACMATIPTHPTTWHAEDYFAPGFEFLAGNLRMEPEVALKPGVPVLLTKNYDLEQGLVNGSRGIVDRIITTCALGVRRCANPRCSYCAEGAELDRASRSLMEFQDETEGMARGAALSRYVPVVRFGDREMAVLPATSAIKSRTRKRAAAKTRKRASDAAVPAGKRHPSLASLAPRDADDLPPDEIEEADGDPDDPEVLACREQVPLAVAFGFTIHKVQGMTMDSVCICWDRVFAPGQVYVALSRVRSLQGVAIRSSMVPISRITMSQKAIEFESRCLPVPLPRSLFAAPAPPRVAPPPPTAPGAGPDESVPSDESARAPGCGVTE